MTDDDEDLFRRAMTGTRPLKAPPRAEPRRRRPKPVARFARADEQSVLLESLSGDPDPQTHDAPESLRFHRPGVGRRTMRKLARGGFSVQGEIDLHGMTVAEAKPRLAEFIDAAAREAKSCVRIVHGKGHGSGRRGPVLKRKVDRWLRQWDGVLAFVSAPPVDGGTGAVYVLLKSR